MRGGKSGGTRADSASVVIVSVPETVASVRSRGCQRRGIPITCSARRDPAATQQYGLAESVRWRGRDRVSGVSSPAVTVVPDGVAASE